MQKKKLNQAIIPSLTVEEETQFNNLFSVLFQSDSYKYSHPAQFMDEIEGMYDYYENRGGKAAEVFFYGLEYYLKRYLGNKITTEIIAEVDEAAQFHGIPFEREAFEAIVNEYNGYLPVRIRALPEGVMYDVKLPLFSIEETDKRYFWLVGFLETLLMKVWYTSAVATKAMVVKDILTPYFEKTSAAPEIAVQYAYHNFGARGSTVPEQAIVGGMAHLQVFNGTDNFAAVKAMKLIHGKPMSDYVSISATEHSTTTSAGKAREYAFVERFVSDQISKGRKLFAAVMDSYDYRGLVSQIIAEGSSIRKMLVEAGAKLVLRPDSGDQEEIIGWTARAMKAAGVCYPNNKGYTTSDIFSVIWGDGVTPETINKMCKVWVGQEQMSMDVLAFGSGGDLMQNVNRDSHKTAIKCSSVTLDDGSQRDVFKDPITDPGKKSKKGRVTTVRNRNTGEVYAVSDRFNLASNEEDMMEDVYCVGPAV